MISGKDWINDFESITCCNQRYMFKQQDNNFVINDILTLITLLNCVLVMIFVDTCAVQIWHANSQSNSTPSEIVKLCFRIQITCNRN